MNYKDYYQILGVSKAADEKEIKRAYRKLALRYHPDKNPGNKQAEEKFKELNEAYEVLGNPDNRSKYDRLGSNYHRYQQMGGNPGDFDFSQWFNQGGSGGSHYQSNVNLNDLFGDGGSGGFSEFFQRIFGSDFGQSSSGGFQQSSFGTGRQSLDLEETVEITLEEVFHGTTRTFSENGSRFTAKIPAGTTDGSKIRLRGKGHHGHNGRGDLYLLVKFKPHDTFKAEGINLRTTISVNVVTAVLGGKVTVPTLTGEGQLTIPAGTQGGQTFRLKGKGLPNRKSKENPGDLFVKINIKIPTKLSAEERQLYEQLSLINLHGEPTT